jgi:hypothetical protein
VAAQSKEATAFGKRYDTASTASQRTKCPKPTHFLALGLAGRDTASELAGKKVHGIEDLVEQTPFRFDLWPKP